MISYKKALIFHALSPLKTIQVTHNLGIILIAAKTIESKHPKFMRTIEEVGGPHA